jgi:hypothetical protein
VAFAVTSGGGSVNPVTGTTDAAGRFSTTWTLGSGSGAQTVRASSGSLPPVSFTATAASSIGITIVVPRPNVVVADSFFLIARGSSTEVVSATATVEGGATSPLRLTSGPEFSGYIRMPAGPPGPREVVVRASAANGDSAFARINVILDRPPTLAVTAPAEGTVARPGMRVDADCTDDDPAGCTTAVYLDFGSTPATSGTGGVHTTVSAAAHEGRRMTVRVRATDPRGQFVEQRFHVFVESSPRLTEIVTAPAGRLWDYDAARLLYLDVAPWTDIPRNFAVRVRDRASGSVATLRQFTDPYAIDWTRYKGVLHPQGALFNADGVWDWRNGTLTRQPGGGVLAVDGNWAAWPLLYRMNLLNGSTDLVTSSASSGGYDVGPNGDVVYTSAPYEYDIYRYRDGVITQISDPADSLMNIMPVTDGINVVWLRTNSFSNGTGQRASIVMAGPAGTVELAGPRAYGDQQYAAQNGWVAFTLVDAGARAQVWTRSPSGELRQATFRSASSSIRALGPNGELAFGSGGRFYVVLAPYTGAPVDIGGDAFGFGEGRVEWRNGELIRFLGRSAFRVDD